MSVAHLDRVDTLEAVEFLGRLTSMKRMARVTGLTANDYKVLSQALTDVGVPVPGTYLDENDVQGENLILVSRTPRIVNQDAGTVDVLLDYDHVLNGPYQNLRIGDGQGRLYGKFQTSLNEVETNKVFIYDMPINQNPDIINQIGQELPIVLSYVYPPGNGPHAGSRVDQGGKIKVFQGQANYTLDGYIDTNEPWIIEGNMLNRINSVDFLGGLPRTWICSEVQYSLLAKRSPTDPAKARYKFHFEFNYNPEEWVPEAVFIDPKENRPPAVNLTRQDTPIARGTTPAELAATGVSHVYGWAGQVRVYYFFEIDFGTYLGTAGPVNFEGS